MPNGDLVTGASDGFVRIFSASEERWAPAADLKAYDDLVASTAVPAQQVGDVKKSDLPGEEALLQPGTSTGSACFTISIYSAYRQEGRRSQDDTER